MKTGANVLITVIVLIAVVYIGYIKFNASKATAPQDSSAGATSPQATSTDIRVPFSREKYGAATRADFQRISVLAQEAHVKLSFQEIINPENQAINAARDDIYLDNTKIGQLAGSGGESMPSLSSDKKYLAFREELDMGCAGLCSIFQIYVLNLADKNFTALIDSPRKDQDYSGDRSHYAAIVPFMSYVWNYDDSLNITFFFVGVDKSTAKTDQPQYYRISPREVWRYDLATSKYTLIQTLPENQQ